MIVSETADQAPFRFGPIEAPTLKDKIGLHVRTAILDGHLPPGTRIVETAVAKEMHVAQTSIREGLMELVMQGFLVKYVNRETVVRKLDAGAMENLFRVRVELEGLAAELACANANEQSLAPLSQWLTQMRDAARNGETAAFYQSDIQFHQSMWRLPGNEFLERALVPLSIGPVTFFLAGSPLLPPNQRDLLRVVAEHEEILEALRKGPGRACRKVIVSKIKTWRDQQRKYVLSASSK